jgi:predicted N-acetyltransferase YhbS
VERKNMADMLVRLYDLPDTHDRLRTLADRGVIIRRAAAWERKAVVQWIEKHFGDGWASECEVAFSGQPVTCLIATRDRQIVGFGCYDATCLNFFGPAGVDERERGQGIGSGILLVCLEAMRAAGYAYAIIGGVGPKEFYRRVAGAIEIPDSSPGIYTDILR